MHPDGPGRIRISKHGSMKTDAIMVADLEHLGTHSDDRSPNQLVNTASLDGIVGNAWAMADWHFGYGFPIGGVVATDINSGNEGGAISPGGVGFDINCGVRLCALDIRPIRTAVWLRYTDLAPCCPPPPPDTVGGLLIISNGEPLFAFAIHRSGVGRSDLQFGWHFYDISLHFHIEYRGTAMDDWHCVPNWLAMTKTMCGVAARPRHCGYCVCLRM